MNLEDVIGRTDVPVPWAEGDNIPWSDPEFSRRMLVEHLSQDHDAASRRSERIDAHVDWVHGSLLAGKRARILDLGCGPGLYLQRLAKLGHDCVGVDYGPASLRHAASQAAGADLLIEYKEGDLRTVEYGSGFDLVMQVFGELNVFTPADAKTILRKAHESLNDGGMILMEVHTFECVQRLGETARSWYSAKSGLFADGPHFCLQEYFWDSDKRTATIRFFVIDAVTANVTRHAQSVQAYQDEEYRDLFTSCGFSNVDKYPSLIGTEDESQKDLMAFVARKA